MADMFGTPVGRSHADVDMAREAMLGPQVLQSVMQSAAIPGQIEQRAAQSRYLGAKADALEVEADVQREVARMASAGGLMEVDGSTPQNPVWGMAGLYQKAGDLKTAAKLAGQASSIDQRIASADTNAAREKLISARRVITEMDTLSRKIRSAESPEQFQAILQQNGAMQFLDQQGNLLPQVSEQWETVRDRIVEESISEKDRLRADYLNDALDSAERERKSRQAARTFWQDTNNQEARARAQARGRGVKVGADELGKPTGRTMATNLVSSQYTIADPNQAKVLGAKVAERAQQLRDRNPALTTQEALDLGLGQLKDEGLLEGVPPRRRGEFDSKNFTPALPLPSNRDRGQLKSGQYYKGPDGVRQWLGVNGWGPLIKEDSAAARYRAAISNSGKGAAVSASGRVRSSGYASSGNDEEVDGTEDELEDTAEDDELALEE